MTALPQVDARAERHAEFVSLFASALRGEECTVHGLHATPRALPVAAWDREVDRGDRALLRHCRGPVLDVGCGPGRMAAWLARHGVEALGIDLVPAAVASARARGARAEVADVFDVVPSARSADGWGSVLLADGNIGIGGDPVALLRRARDLLAPAGRVVAEVAAAGTGLQARMVRLEGAGSVAFRWALVGPEAVPALAAEAGLAVAVLERRRGRGVAVLVREAS